MGEAGGQVGQFERLGRILRSGWKSRNHADAGKNHQGRAVREASDLEGRGQGGEGIRVAGEDCLWEGPWDSFRPPLNTADHSISTKSSVRQEREIASALAPHRQS